MHMRFLQIICVMLLLLGTSGCIREGKFYPWWAKAPNLDLLEAPNGPPVYQQGYKDGCQTALSAWSPAYNAVWWSFKQDPKLRYDPVYSQIWGDAYGYCAAFVNSDHGLTHYGQPNKGFWPF